MNYKKVASAIKAIEKLSMHETGLNLIKTLINELDKAGKISVIKLYRQNWSSCSTLGSLNIFLRPGNLISITRADSSDENFIIRSSNDQPLSIFFLYVDNGNIRLKHDNSFIKTGMTRRVKNLTWHKMLELKAD